MTSFLRLIIAACAAALLVPGTALAGHGLKKFLDHPAPLLPSPSNPNPAFQSEGEGDWELVGSIPTGNPHSDLDFFTQKGETYASVGTLGTGPNRGGQTIVQLTEGGEVKPKLLSGAPTATCVSNPIETLGLQHDVEATPKGRAPLNTFNPFADAGDAQLIVDATDAPGRCHDQGTLGVAGAPQGGLEIIDITDPASPVTIGLTSHIGEAHTVNIDPKRPHIAYAVTSDQVTVNGDGVRTNELPTSTSKNLDGFEVVDLSSCMNFPQGTTVEAKRAACAPTVFRYRWPTVEMGLGHTKKTNVFGCHELEVYPDDRLTCGSGTALITLDMKGAFDDGGTPNDFRDDKPRGTPLPCHRRPSSSSRLAAPGSPSFFTEALVVDCDNGGADGKQPLRVSEWLKIGAPSLEGVRYLGSVHHEGGTDQAANPTYGPEDDIIFNHEAELSHSGRLLIATDERGGGVLPPGATCTAGNANPRGNGGVSFYRTDRLRTTLPGSAEEAWQAFAQTPDGKKAIYRAPIRTGAQATICTAHVFQQIPGQNRIFMGWYSQGTQVLDFTERPDGTVEIKEVGSFIPAAANQWVSHIFKTQENPDGTFTYWGAAGDFRLSEGGRNTIDVYRVTLPAPPKPLTSAQGAPTVLPESVRGRTVTDPQTGRQVVADSTAGAPSCTPGNAIRSTTVSPTGRNRGGLSFGFRASAPVTVDLFQQSQGRQVTGERLIRRWENVRGSIRWNGRDRRGRALRDGVYFVRFRARRADGRFDVARVPVQRRSGRWSRLLAFDRRDSCALLRSFKLERPVFGGQTNRALLISFRTSEQARATVVVRRGNRVVRRFPVRSYAPGRVQRLRMTVTRRIPRGTYRVSIEVRTPDGRRATGSLTSRRL
jgi:hypothetical protein